MFSWALLSAFFGASLRISAAAPAATSPLPRFVLDYAPYSYLDNGETYWPGDIADFVRHVVPQVNYAAVAPSVTLDSLAGLSKDTYLTSKDNVTNVTQPKESWLLSEAGKPAANGVSAAPATIIAVQKPNGIVDAFYFYFYPYNLGPLFTGYRWDNHVGDWEHTMVRFSNGKPVNVYLSTHGGGSAYTYSALPKATGTERPITYIASGSHANYAVTGTDKYPVPIVGPVTDHTDAGVAWDITKNFRGYWYDVASAKFTPAGGSGKGGTEQQGETTGWLQFKGMWGDNAPKGQAKSKQYCVFGECHFTPGPTGAYS